MHKQKPTLKTELMGHLHEWSYYYIVLSGHGHVNPNPIVKKKQLLQKSP